MPHHSTKGFAGAACIPGWNDFVGKSAGLTPARVANLNSSETEDARLGDIRLSAVRATSAKVIRSEQQGADNRGRRYLIHLQLEGASLVRHVGRDARLSVGDLVICDSSLPYVVELDEASLILILSASATDIRQRLPSPEFVLGKKLNGDSGLSATLSLVIASVWRDAQQGMSHDVASRVGATLLDLLATSCMNKFGDRVADAAIGSARRSHVLCHIENRLKDPNLTVASIAQVFRISPRYLHMLFADEGETVCEYIRRRRLEECKRQLSDPMWMRRSISELAYTWGFNNTTHFARVFRDQFGVSPRDFRNASLADGRKS